MSASDVRALFPGAWWHDVFEQMRSEVPVYFVEGGLEIEGSLAAGAGPWALVVHGDLHATGDLDFGTGDYKTSLLVVQGNVRARNFRFTNGANCVVAHDLRVSEHVFGRYGDESAMLGVGGVLAARAVLLDHVTGIDAEHIDAVVCTVEGWGLPIDIDYYAENRDVFVPAALDDEDGTLDCYGAWQLASRGEPVLLPGAEERLRAARPGSWSAKA